MAPMAVMLSRHVGYNRALIQQTAGCLGRSDGVDGQGDMNAGLGVTVALTSQLHNSCSQLLKHTSWRHNSTHNSSNNKDNISEHTMLLLQPEIDKTLEVKL